MCSRMSCLEWVIVFRKAWKNEAFWKESSPRVRKRRVRMGHPGWRWAMFAGMDMPSSSAITQKKLGWKPTGPGLIADLDGMDYSKG